MTRSVTDDAKGRVAKALHELFSRFSAGSLNEERTLAGLQLVLEDRLPGLPQTPIVTDRPDWHVSILKEIWRKLKRFSRAWVTQATDTPFPASWTPEFLANAATYNMKPVFLPGADIDEKFTRKGWTKPEQWFYDRVRDNRVKGEMPTRLERGWYLVDHTVGVDYANGAQVMPNDPWAPLITRLRSEKRIGANDVTPSGSRFAITYDEWIQVVLAHMAGALQVSRAQVSLERAIEFNAIGNIYDSNRGKFNMWEWFHDHFDAACALFGGYRARGGLARVSLDGCGSRLGYITARPLVRFVATEVPTVSGPGSSRPAMRCEEDV